MGLECALWQITPEKLDQLKSSDEAVEEFIDFCFSEEFDEEVVTTKPIQRCKVLDVGCGTGDNSIWLAQHHFQVIGTDTSDIALERAKEKASKANKASYIYNNCSYNG